MATEALPLGYPVTMLQNVVYALPAIRCMLYASEAGTPFQVSNTLSFASSTTPALTDGRLELAGGFIRYTNASTIVCLKRA